MALSLPLSKFARRVQSKWSLHLEKVAPAPLAAAPPSLSLIRNITTITDRVRVGGAGIPINKRLEFSLQYIQGIGRSTARQILANLSRENKVTRDLSQEELISLRDEVSKYLTEGDLRRTTSNEIKRLKDIGCFRGTQHASEANNEQLPDFKSGKKKEKEKKKKKKKKKN